MKQDCEQARKIIKELAQNRPIRILYKAYKFYNYVKKGFDIDIS